MFQGKGIQRVQYAQVRQMFAWLFNNLLIRLIVSKSIRGLLFAAALTCKLPRQV